jgi:uncharacterized protein YecT (DUF1311 family)
MIRLPLAAFAALLLSASAAAAQDDSAYAPTEEDWRMMKACLDDRTSAGVSRTDCIGVVSDPCLADPDNQSTPGMNGCLSKEVDMWDHYLNQWYGILTDRLRDEPEKAKGLKEAQRAWITMRDLTCEFEASLWDGGTGANTAYLGCLNTLTGQRAEFLNQMVDLIGE